MAEKNDAVNIQNKIGKLDRRNRIDDEREGYERSKQLEEARRGLVVECMGSSMRRRSTREKLRDHDCVGEMKQKWQNSSAEGGAEETSGEKEG